VNTLTLSRNQSLELRLTQSFRRGTNAPQIYRINSNMIRETTSRITLDEPKSIISEKEHAPSNMNSSVVQNEDITIDMELPTIIDHDEDIPHKKFSIYEEEENIIIEDETDGNVYVINNSPSSITTPTTTPPTTTPPITTQEIDSDSQKSNSDFFSLFKKSSQEQNDR